MMLSCAFTLLVGVSAEDEVALVAPVAGFTQSSDVKDGKQNIRFLAGVKDLAGEKLGYDIVAEFTYEGSYRRVSYGGADYETDTVFEYVWAKNIKCYPSDFYGENSGYNYWFAMTISDIPADIGDIYFRIKTYIVDENGEKTYSEEVCTQYTSGKLDKSLSVQDYNDLSGTFDSCLTSDVAGKEIVLGSQSTGWTLAFQNNWSGKYADTISFADGAARLKVNGDYIRLVDKSVVEDMYKYSIDVDVQIIEAGVLNFMFNSGSNEMASYAASNTGLKVRLGGVIGTNVISGSGNNFISAANAGNTALGVMSYAGTANNGLKKPADMKLNDKLHLTIDVDNFERVMNVYINGALIDTYSFGASFSSPGGIFLALQETDIIIDNLRVYGEKYDAKEVGDVVYSQNFDSLSASTDTDAVLAAAGFNVVYEKAWSTPSKYAEITADGKLKLNGGGTAYEIVSNETLAGVNEFTLQFDANIESLGVMEILFTKTHTDYSAIECNSVMFRGFASAAENAEWNDSCNYLGYLIQYINAGTKANMGVKQTNIGDSSAFGKTYKVVIEVNIGESISVSIYDGTTKVGETRTATAADGTLVENVNSICIRLQKAPITVDNIVMSVGSYSDYCL